MSEKSKPFEPTHRKLTKSRAEGDVAKSRLFSAALILTLGIASLFIVAKLSAIFVEFAAKSFSSGADFIPGNMIIFMQEGAGALLLVVGPLFLTVFASAILSEALQVGVEFHFQNLAPKASRLSVFSGLKRLLGAQTPEESAVGIGLLIEVWKFSAMLLIFLSIATAVVWPLFPELVGALEIELLPAISLAVLWRLFLALAGSALLLGGLDLLSEQKKRRKRLRMDFEEFKRELREAEGDPEMKGMRKQLAHEILFHGFLQSIRRAKVVVVNKDRGC